MKRLYLLLLLALTLTAQAQLDANRISVMGSSVANGVGAKEQKGYASMYNDLLAERYASQVSPNPFYTSNISVNGNSSLNLLARYDDLQRDKGKYVIYGISLGNEGIHAARDYHAIFNQYHDNMLKLIAMARAEGKIPVVMNNYTRTDFTPAEYSYIKELNRLMGYWDVPTVNLLGAIDNGRGQWAPGYGNGFDIYHPNTDGHREFFYAMVPSLFDALASGKPLTMDRTKQTEGRALKNGTTIMFEPEGTVHSFTLALTAEADGLLANIYAADHSLWSIVRQGDKYVLRHDDADVLAVPAPAGLAEIYLSQNYAIKRLTLNVNGHEAETTAAFAPVSIVIGGHRASDIRVGELMFYRSSMHTLSPFASDQLFKSSLELYSSLAPDTPFGPLPNAAMSTAAARLAVPVRR